jgi:hypothetical protein
MVLGRGDTLHTAVDRDGAVPASCARAHLAQPVAQGGLVSSTPSSRASPTGAFPQQPPSEACEPRFRRPAAY